MTRIAVEPQAWKLKELARLMEKAEGFPAIQAALAEGHSATVDGAWGSSCALVAAALAARVPRTLFVVASRVCDVDDLCDDIASFLGRTVASFAAWERLPREEVVADEIFGQRLRLLKSLSLDPAPPVVVTSIQALLQPVPSCESILRHSRRLQVGEAAPRDELLRWLIDSGFNRRDAVELSGEFSVRGGILDIFPPDLTSPIRVEFFGDEIESIRAFDIETQRSTAEFSGLAVSAAPTRAFGDTVEPTAQELVHFCSHVKPGSWLR